MTVGISGLLFFCLFFFPSNRDAGNRAPDLVGRGRQGQARGLVDFGNRGREHVAVQIGKSFDLALRQPKHNPQFRHGEGLAVGVFEVHEAGDVLIQQDRVF